MSEKNNAARKSSLAAAAAAPAPAGPWTRVHLLAILDHAVLRLVDFALFGIYTVGLYKERNIFHI